MRNNVLSIIDRWIRKFAARRNISPVKLNSGVDLDLNNNAYYQGSDIRAFWRSRDQSGPDNTLRQLNASSTGPATNLRNFTAH